MQPTPIAVMADPPPMPITPAKLFVVDCRQDHMIAMIVSHAIKVTPHYPRLVPTESRSQLSSEPRLHRDLRPARHHLEKDTIRVAAE